MCKKLVLIGAGGFGREVQEIIAGINKREKTYDLLGFLDDGKQYNCDSIINGMPWIGPTSWIIDHKEDVWCTCTIGKAATKARIQRELMNQGVRFETIIAPTAGVSRFTEIGPGSVLYWNAGVSVN